MAKQKAFEGDGAERFFSLGDIPPQKYSKKQQKLGAEMRRYLDNMMKEEEAKKKGSAPTKKKAGRKPAAKKKTTKK